MIKVKENTSIDKEVDDLIERLKCYMDSKGITIKQIAKRTNMSISTVSMFINKRRHSNLTISKISKIIPANFEYFEPKPKLPGFKQLSTKVWAFKF